MHYSRDSPHCAACLQISQKYKWYFAYFFQKISSGNLKKSMEMEGLSQGIVGCYCLHFCSVVYANIT